MAFTDEEINLFVEGYLQAALWSSTDESDESGGEPMDANYDVSDIDPQARTEQREECIAFLSANALDIRAYIVFGRPISHAGHDFWLNRNGHGAGFWDRGMGALGDRLSEACKVYGGVNAVVGHDDRIYFE